MRGLSLRDPAFLAIVGGVDPPEFVSAASAAGNTVSMPSHETGDLIVAFAVRQDSTTPPSLPAGWTAHDTGGVTIWDSYRVGRKVAASSGETTGTWTNANGIVVVVFRGAGPAALGASVKNSSATATSATFGAIPTPDVSDKSSIFLQFAMSNGSHSSFNTPPSGSGMTHRAGGTAGGSGPTWAAHSTADGASSYPGGTTAFGTTRRYATYVTEVKAGPP